ncbi:hypothetical protein B0H16DRAFT_1701915 [Mycena metata]|uniref:Uncharacterized protein n=1 Tax=Mycena metata TaxID=1033252 RepID=A0AAD7H9N2_9AGAR|nr:hypothetical protein B0H16DRAFT_1701915 [Mycena metata]
MPSVPQTGDIIVVPAYAGDDSATVEVQWQQTFRSKSATYYIVKAKNQSQGNADILLYIQDRFYKDESSGDFIGKLLGCKKEDGRYIVTLNDRFQYGQKNKNGDERWVCLHDKDNKIFQHRFLVTTVQGKAADWAKTLANGFGAGEIAANVHKLGGSFVGDYLHTF